MHCASARWYGDGCTEGHCIVGPALYGWPRLSSAVCHICHVTFGVHTWLSCRVQQGSSEAERALLECSLVSLQAIQQAVGADSAQYRAASKVTMKLVQIIQTLLSNAYDGR